MASTEGPSPRQGAIEGRLIRGGTSKGFFVKDSELPDVDEELLDTLVLELFGTPDPLQVDGIGGSHSHTSKLMIVSKSNQESVDVDYTFGQVAIEKPVIDWSGNCGNLTSAIGTFALLEGMIDAAQSPAEVTLHNTNTGITIEQVIPTKDGVPNPYGDYSIDGVPGIGSRVDSTFIDPGGSVFDSVMPTGSASETVTVGGTAYEISLIDVTNPCVFVRAGDLGMDGTELPTDISEDPELLETLEMIRGTVAERLGIVDDAKTADQERPTTPFIAMVTEPKSYETSVNTEVVAADIDITGRIVTTQTPHHAYAMTGAMSLAAATQLPGTVPNAVAKTETSEVTIGHPKGTLTVAVDVQGTNVESVTVGRTVREIMRGTALYRYIDGLEKLDAGL